MRGRIRERATGPLVDRIRLTLAGLALVNVLAGGLATGAAAGDGRPPVLAAALVLWLAVGAVRERVPVGGGAVEAVLLGSQLALTGDVDLLLAPFYTVLLFRASYDTSPWVTVGRSALYFSAFAAADVVSSGEPTTVVAIFLAAHAAAFVAVPLLSLLLVRSLTQQDAVVTRLQDAQRDLATSEQRFRGLFEGAGAGMAVTDLQGRFVDANGSYIRMLGYTLEELRETDFLSITHPDDRDPNSSHIRALLAGEVSDFGFEKRYLAKDGSIVWVRARISLVRDRDGQPLHIAATTEDITAAKAAEERLRRSEHLRRLAGQLALVGGWSIEADDLTLYWSDEIFRILDVAEGEEPSLETALDLYPPEHREPLEAAIGACLEHGTPFDMELEIITFAGRRIPVRATAEAERDELGAVRRVIGAFQDVTELRRASLEAREAADRLTATLESMTDAFYTFDRSWRFTFVNRRAGQLLRRDPVELVGRHIWEEFPEAAEGELFDAYNRALDSGQTQVLREFFYPPLDTWFEVNAYPSAQGVAVYFRDVTDIRAARLALLDRERTLERQAALLDQAQDAILVRDLDHRITFWNAGAERVYGWTAEEAVGQDVRTLLFEDTGQFDRAMAVVAVEGSWSGELTQRTRDGATVLASGRWSLLHDESGAPEAVLAINTDVTEQRRVEQQLLRAQRMESIGTLASGVAHDLNNVLSPIQLAAELLRLDDRSPKERELLNTITTSAKRGSDLVQQVLSFARGVDGARVPVDVGAVLADVHSIVRDTFPRDITLDLDVEPGLPSLIGDSTQIQQVLLNLAVNARDAMPDGGTLTLRATRTLVDEAYTTSVRGSQVGSHLLVEVEDTGSGMPPEVRDRIFEPFFTTKPQGSGTGLGLSTSAGIISSHGGWITVYSEPGNGTTFRIYLPASPEGGAATTAPAEPASAPRPPRSNGQVVLLVEDEAAVRAMTRQTLETFGYRVIEAANGAEASRYAQHQDEVDLVLKDMVMLVMDGPATIRALRELDPDLVIVGASGLHGNGKVAQAAAAGIVHFIPKPYSAQALLETLERALRRDAPTGDAG
jgi:two-component system, cell cycle sensor histidine kinase and response regulator CckA